MTERKSLSKKVRFEVFKRDSFTCQYCGMKAPEVILEVDHINPIKEGGSNELINLVTSCMACNRGKSFKKLSDNSIVEKQRRQIEELNLRRQQLEMMLLWRDGLNESASESTNKAIKYWNDKWDDLSLSKQGEEKVQELVKKFGLINVLNAMDIAVDRYRNENIDLWFINSFSKIGGICFNSSRPDIEKEISFIKSICRNRFSYWNETEGSIIINYYVNALKNQGLDELEILKDLKEEVTPLSRRSSCWSMWRNTLESWTEDIVKLKKEP